MMVLFADASEASRTRYDLAARLTSTCPSQKGAEIALTGSAARGRADEYSDVEINLWVEEIPDEEERLQWLQRSGATDLTPQWVDGRDRTHWITFRLSGTWVEIGWAQRGEYEEHFRRILRGEGLSDFDLALPWVVQHAVALRTDGWLRHWQHELTRYPDVLQQHIISGNTSAWSDPHVPYVRWTLAARSQLFALSRRLSWDIDNVLSILWAVNRQWQQDLKWTDDRSLPMPIRPEQLGERINAIFALTSPRESIRTCFELIVEVLDLVPEEYDVSQAKSNILAALQYEQAYG